MISLQAFLAPFPAQFFDDNGVPLAGGKLWTYAAGTVGNANLLATYTTADASVQNANPQILDAAGRATVFLGKNAYKMILTDSTGQIDILTGMPAAGSVIWSVDNVVATGANVATGFLQAPTVADTLTGLVALSGVPTGTLAYTQGYTSSTDGGGDFFVYSSSSTATPDGGMIIAPTNNVGRWFRKITSSEINVVWYGADASGSSDSKPAFAAANAWVHNAGNAGNILVPNGTFRLNTNPLLDVPVRFLSHAQIVWNGFSPAIIPIIDDMTIHFGSTALISPSDAPIFPLGAISKAQWFGAVGDGIHNDAQAFQTAVKALSNSGTLIVPSATYALTGNGSDPIIEVGTHVTVQGEGDGSRSVFSVVTTGSPVGVFASAAGAYSVVFDSIAIQGGSIASTVGIALDASDSAIRNCKLSGFTLDAIRVGFRNQNSTNVRVTDNALSDSGNATSGHINVFTGRDIYVERNTISNAASVGLFAIQLYRTGDTTSTQPLSRVFVRDNDVCGCCILCHNSAAFAVSSVEIVGNRVDLSSVPGYNNPVCIFCAGLEGDITISGNVLLTGAVNGGVYIQRDSNAHIGNYEVRDNTVYLMPGAVTAYTAATVGGIGIGSAQDFTVVVTDNTVFNQSASGSYVFGIYEYGSTWDAGFLNVKYGANDLLGFTNDITNHLYGQTKSMIDRYVDIATNVNIPGNLTVGGSINISSTLPRGYIDGFQMSIHDGDTSRCELAIGLGACCLADTHTPAQTPVVSGGFFKMIVDSNNSTVFKGFAFGSGNGAVSTTPTYSVKWLHVFVIKGSLGTVDIGADDSITAVNIIARADALANVAPNYERFSANSYRRIGSIAIQADTRYLHIKRFVQTGDVFSSSELNDTGNDYVQYGNSSGTITLPLTSVPPDVSVDAKIQLYVVSGGAARAKLRVYRTGDVPATANGYTLWGVSTNGASQNDAGGFVNVVTDVSTPSSPSIGVDYYLVSDGEGIIHPVSYLDFRGRDL